MGHPGGSCRDAHLLRKYDLSKTGNCFYSMDKYSSPSIADVYVKSKTSVLGLILTSGIWTLVHGQIVLGMRFRLITITS